MILQTYNFTGCSLRWWEGCILERRAALHVSASQRPNKGLQRFHSLPSGIGSLQGVKIQVVDRFVAGSHDGVKSLQQLVFHLNLTNMNLSIIASRLQICCSQLAREQK
jgi:hypothetical protein